MDLVAFPQQTNFFMQTQQQTQQTNQTNLGKYNFSNKK